MNELRIYDGEFIGEIAGSLVFMTAGGIGFPIKGLPSSLTDSVNRLFVYEKTSTFNGETSRHGFARREDFELFKLLLDNDVKPAVGTSIVNTICQEHDIRLIVNNNDVAILQQAPGVGKTTAKKIIESLKPLFGGSSDILDIDNEVFELLVGLGFSKSEAEDLLKNNPRTDGESNSEFAARLALI